MMCLPNSGGLKYEVSFRDPTAFFILFAFLESWERLCGHNDKTSPILSAVWSSPFLSFFFHFIGGRTNNLKGNKKSGQSVLRVSYKLSFCSCFSGHHKPPVKLSCLQINVLNIFQRDAW